MKKLLGVFVLVCLCGSVEAQYTWNANKEVAKGSYPSNSNVNPDFLRVSLPLPIAKPPGVRMRDTGIGLIVGGTVLLVAGVALLSSANYNFTTTNSNGIVTNQVDPKFTYGIVFATEGTGLFITGIVFASMGSKKFKRYQAQQKVSFNLRGAGAVVRFRF